MTIKNKYTQFPTILLVALFMVYPGMAQIVFPVPGVSGPRAVEPSNITVALEYVGNFPNDLVTSNVANMSSPVAHNGYLYGIDNFGAIYRSGLEDPVYTLEDALLDGIDVVNPNTDPLMTSPFNIGSLKPFTNLAGSQYTNKLYLLVQTLKPAEDVPTAYLPGQNPSGSKTARIETFALDGDDDGIAEVTLPFPVDIYNLEAVFFTPPVLTEPAVVPKNFFYTLYEFEIGEKKLVNPRAIASLQGQSFTRHDGGALALAPDGRIILATGDYTGAGMGGRAAPQQLTNLPDEDLNPAGKIILIDPENGEMQIAAIGLRNSEKFTVVGEGANRRLVWGEIGRTLAEELNTITMSDLLSPPIENFGWGCSAGVDGQWASDGNCENLPVLIDHGRVNVVVNDGTEITREGTFKIRQGILGGGPLRISNGPQNPLDTSVKPLAQYSRWTEGLPFAAISGPAISSVSFTNITALFGDLGSGRAYAITDGYDGVDVQVKRVNLVKDETALPNNSFNGVPILDGECTINPAEFEFCRVDPRFFTFPDGSAGVLFERTGNYYRLTQVQP